MGVRGPVSAFIEVGAPGGTSPSWHRAEIFFEECKGHMIFDGPDGRLADFGLNDFRHRMGHGYGFAVFA